MMYVLGRKVLDFFHFRNSDMVYILDNGGAYLVRYGCDVKKIMTYKFKKIVYSSKMEIDYDMIYVS